MIITERDKQEQDLYIKTFQTHFIKRFGIMPEVTINNQETVNITVTDLEDLEKIVQRFIPPMVARHHPKFITKTRKRELVVLRMIFMMLAKDMEYSLKTIGQYCGGRDHSTVVYNINSGYDLLETDKDFQKLYISISQIVNPKLYPDVRISQVIDETQDQCQSANTDSLYTRKYKVFRPASRYDRRTFNSKAERAYQRAELTFT